jgi:signal transduction histidine kinase
MGAERVILVEEEDTIRALLQRLLKREGYAVAAFSRTVDAVAHIRAGFVPQVAILNPEKLVGVDLLLWLEKDPVLSRVPICDSAGDIARIADRVHELLAPPPSETDAVEFVAENYGLMAAQLPGLLERVKLLSEAAGNEDRVKAALERAGRGGRRMRSFVRYLKDYGRSAGEARAPTDVRAALDFAIETAEHEITHRGRLIREIASLPSVMANERQLSHVFLSLLVNAAHALKFDADAQKTDTNWVRVSAHTDENGWAVVDVIDSGSGIAPEILPQIFEPYFSTKRGAGMGLGLYLSRAALRAWGGSISCVASEPGRGSTFRVELPPASPRPNRERA